MAIAGFSSGELAKALCVGLVTAQYRAAVLDPLADDVELENVGPPAVPFVGRWRGRDAVAEAIGRNFGYLADQRPEVLSVVAQGDTVVVTARERGRYRPTGRAYDRHWVQHFTWRDGRLVRFRQVFDAAALLEAASGSGEPAAEPGVAVAQAGG